MSTRTMTRVLVVSATALGSLFIAGRAAGSPGDGPTVELLDPGRAPHQKLRLTAKVGQHFQTVMALKMGMRVVVGGQEQPVPPFPTMRFTMDQAVTGVDARGDIQWKFGIIGAEILDDEQDAGSRTAAEKLRPLLKSLEGLTGATVMTDRGEVTSVRLEEPAQASAQLRQLIGQMKASLKQASTVLPEPPVGLGARWAVKARHVAGGVTSDSRTVYLLTALAGGRYQVKTETKITAPAQTIAAGELVSLTGKGEGEMTGDLRCAAAPRGKTSQRVTMRLRATGQEMEMEIRTAVLLGR
ncbi:MAG TPA: DUF6263 family protein [Polyangia bacterium]|jgi:hypothetical protein